MDERRITPVRRETDTDQRDRRVAEIAGDAWGIVTVAELRTCGLTDNAIASRRRRGWLHRLHPGVYAVGHPNPTWEGRLLAAVRACGPAAVLSHHSAAELWGFLDREERSPQVTVAGGSTRRHAGIRVHRTLSLGPSERRRELGVPVTSPARTLLDLAPVLPPKGIRAAVRRAHGLRLLALRQIGELLEQHPRRRGCAVLRRVISSGAAPTQSELESEVLDLILSAGLTHPVVNEPLELAGTRVIPDFRWPESRLVVEADGAAWHEGTLARAADAERQALLEAHGHTVVRVSWRQAMLEPEATRERVRAAGAPLADERRLATARR